MARIISPNWSIIRGSIAGITYLSGPGNAIIARQRTRPVNPGSLGQSRIRNLMASQSGVWTTALQSLRNGWDEYGQTIIITTPTGSHTLSGRGAFLSGRSVALYLSNYFAVPGLLTTDFPTDAGREVIADVVVGAPALPITAGFALSVSNNNLYTLGGLFQFSIKVHAARNFWHGPYTPTLTTGATIPSAATTKFSYTYPVTDIGKRVFWRLHAVTLKTPASPHRLSAVFQGSALIVAGA